jgi:iron(III) transport system permease protein
MHARPRPAEILGEAAARGRREIARLRHVPLGWLAAALVLIGLVLLPVATVLWYAVTARDSGWAHLSRTILPRAVLDTLALVGGVGIVSLVIGAGTAWLVTMYRFPGRAWLDRLLVLPLAIPTYILAYAYVDAFDFAGPVQTALRHAFGWRTARDYSFPDLRSLGGAIFILSIALYPYVYLSARASFVQQSVCVLEVARTLGQTSLGAFRTVALPLARPALAAGVALVAMECLNEFGAVQYLGVETLSVAIYATWLQRGSFGGAAQLATVMLVFVFALLLAEKRTRDGRMFHHTTGRYRALPFDRLDGWRAALAVGLCATPVVLGFALPFGLLAWRAAGHLDLAVEAGFWKAAWSSLWLAALVAAVTTAAGLAIAFAVRAHRSGPLAALATVAGVGYALPGTVLALGLILPLAALDQRLDAAIRMIYGVSLGPILSASLILVVLALATRFLAVSLGAIDAGFKRLSPNLDAAARTLGETRSTMLRRVHLPLLLPALASAVLIVFVDAMKELPATLLLRPFNFETLATHVYGLAALEQFEQAALGALAIVLAGLLPVLLLHQAVAGGRSGPGNKM